ncbi:HNH endonuclease signature motif containing protein [Amycolatopsis rhizosphaerae]|uniref:HNH endonuclease signature motif containing protein n=1 Tax=Amycolatopsis rhizosphaerae TaxID=2053003 RepID=UPI001FE5E74C|nr:HNH endonuclease signature motif containing protein [Amycolatopsis rhizosphaerae]
MTENWGFSGPEPELYDRIADLDRDDVLSLIAAAEACSNAYQAVKLAAVAALGDADSVAKEVALELHYGARQAEGQVSLARDLAQRLPATFEAMRQGAVDPYRASKVADQTSVLADEQAREVDARVAGKITTRDATSVRRLVNRTVARVDPDGHARRCEERKRSRNVQLCHEDDGMATLYAYLPAEIAATIYTRVDRVARQLRSRGEERTLDELRADVFSDLCLGVARPVEPPRAEVFVYLDFLTWTGLRNEPAELAGHGPIPAQLARDIAQNATIRRVITDPMTGIPIEVGRHRYRPSAATKELVQVRDRECRVPGCHRPVQACDLDHVEPWAHGGDADSANLCGLCRRDHRLKDEPGWQHRMTETGTLEITTPAGRTYRGEPEPLTIAA